MEFKKISINGISYGDIKKGQKHYIEDLSYYPKVTNVDFKDQRLFDDLEKEEKVRKTLFLLALCHTIIIEK